MIGKTTMKNGIYTIDAIVGDDGRLKVRVRSNDGSHLLIDGISEGTESVVAGLYSTENVETYLVQKRNF